MSRALTRHLLPVGLVLAGLLALLAIVPATSRADVCTPPVVNKVACENSKPGTPSASWWVNGTGDSSLVGFATRMSVQPGDTIHFKIKSDTDQYHIDILRLGYYGGDGARALATGLSPTASSTNQPECQTDASTGLIDCGNWSESASWTVPTSAVSGVYIAHLARDDGTGASQIPFVVRDDSSHSDIVVSTSDATWQAYNIYGGNSLYRCADICPPGSPQAYKGAFKVSYNRPFDMSASRASSLFEGAEYSMILFLEENGYDVSYVSSADVAERGALLKNHKLFISSGHDEYWSGAQRANVEAARDAGVNLAFFSGNEVFWRTRWEPGADGTPDRTLVAYKDTHFATRQDPVEWTGTWIDTRFTTPAEGVTPPNSMTGQVFYVNSGTSTITVPSEYGKLRLWRDTAAASLPAGASLTLAPNTLGYEWDEDADNGYRPAGTFRLSSTTVSDVEVFTDYGSTTQNGQTATHHLTMYRAPSGALVFGAGTVQWAWGLTDENSTGSPPDRNMQQATVNLFADMGVQPATLIPGLVRATQSTDTQAPSSTITQAPTTASDGDQVTIAGTASDAGGGQVGGVEVSTDGGNTWHPATSGTSNWTYQWIAHGAPSVTILTRAVDDSGNLEAPGAGRVMNITCPCSLWGSNYVPLRVGSTDPGSVEVGVKFQPDSFGTITGMRFYKTAGNTGTHVGTLWSADGQRLAKATFENETAGGWQTVTFDSPVYVMPGTTYIASYFAPSGHYSFTQGYFYRPPAPGPNGDGGTPDVSPVRALRNTGSATNGMYSYTTTASTFPVNSFAATNYWVDVIYSPEPKPGAVTNVTASEGGRTSAQVSWSAPSSGGVVTSYKITPYIGNEAQASTVVSGSPPGTSKTVTGLTNGATYTFTVQASNPNGSGPESSRSNPVTPLNPVAPSSPTAVSAIPGSNSARVTWTRSDSDGDSPITSQTVTPYAGLVPQTPVQVDGSAASATVTGLTNGSTYTFRVTATNFVGSSAPSAPSNVVTPQATIFDFSTPSVVDSGDGRSVELGVKFKADYAGSVTGIRFYKASANSGPHIGSLWTADGQRLAQVTFSGESASGWQIATFDTPVAIAANTTYVASYFAPTGHYSASSGGLASAVDNPPLHALSNASANGVFAYSPTSTFPTNSYNATNYWVDVLYALPTPGVPTGVTATVAGTSSADVSWTEPSGGGAVTSYKITPYVGDQAQTPTVISGSPPATTRKITGLTSGTTYTFTVQAVNANGGGAESQRSNAVTPRDAIAPSAPTGVNATPASGSALVTWMPSGNDGDSPITSQTVTPYIGTNAQTPVQVGATANKATITGLSNGTSYTFRVTATNGVGTSDPSGPSGAVIPRRTILDFAAPAAPDSGDADAVELGVKFRADFAGTVTGIRFYKAAANTGTHVGSLWTADGQRLAQATFTGESSTGWQTAIFDAPVDISANTTYVASYFAPNGHYSATSGALAAAIDNGPLHALANGGGANANGVYRYNATSAFPTSAGNGTSYWVDVLFQSAPPPGAPTNVSATAGRSSADVSWTAPSTGGPVTGYKITPYIGGVAQPQQAKSISGSPPATNTTITGLTGGTQYTFRVEASNPSGTGPASAESNAVTVQGASAPGAPTGVTARADSTSVVVSWSAPADDGGAAITGYVVTPYDGSTAGTPVNVGASTTTTRVTGLTNGHSYTLRVAATNSAGTGTASDPSSAVTPRSSIFELATPTVVDSGDNGSVVLGVKFQSDVAGSVIGLRFYKSAANTGSHVGSLWSATGTLLRQATFSDETGSGWQTVTFATPVPITANTTYVASYLAPKGRYSSTSSAFTQVFANPPLRAVATSTSPNGVYAYSAGSVFPGNTFNASNYWVDVLFAPTT